MATTATAMRFYGNDNVPNTLTTANTVTTGRTWIITSLTLANKTSSPVTMIVKVAGITIIPTTIIDGNTALVIDKLSLVANSTETIQVQAGTSSAIAATINGVEVV